MKIKAKVFNAHLIPVADDRIMSGEHIDFNQWYWEQGFNKILPLINALDVEIVNVQWSYWTDGGGDGEMKAIVTYQDYE